MSIVFLYITLRLWFTCHKLCFVRIRFGLVRFGIFKKLNRFGSVRSGSKIFRFGSVRFENISVRFGSVGKFFDLFQLGSKKIRTDPTSGIHYAKKLNQIK